MRSTDGPGRISSKLIIQQVFVLHKCNENMMSSQPHPRSLGSDKQFSRWKKVEWFLEQSEVYNIQNSSRGSLYR